MGCNSNQEEIVKPPQNPSPPPQTQETRTSTSNSPGLEEKLKKIREANPELLKKPDFLNPQEDLKVRLKTSFQNNPNPLKWLKEAATHFPVSRKDMGLRDFTLTDQLFFMQLSKEDELSLLPVFFQPDLMTLRENVYQYLRTKYDQNLGHNPAQWENFLKGQP